jgi:thiol-disulfide isomerase/thioredoxin
MLPLRTPAPRFELIEPLTGKHRTFEELAEGNHGVVIAFICVHCPYVIHLRDRLLEVAREYQARGIQFAAICANDPENYPQDAPEKIAEEAREHAYPFPYLHDDTQEVAKAYRAACTPDFYLFDEHRKLVYRGQFDSSRPGNHQPVTGDDLKAAMDALLAGDPIRADAQRPSVGCNIKWKPGNEPAYFG